MDVAPIQMLHLYRLPWDGDHDLSRELSGWIYQNIGFQNELDQQLSTVWLSFKCKKFKTPLTLSIDILIPSLFPLLFKCKLEMKLFKLIICKIQANLSGKNRERTGGKLWFLWKYIIMVNETLILNTSLYTVKFTDNVEAEYSSNIIAENMWEQCDNVVNQVQLTEGNF